MSPHSGSRMVLSEINVTPFVDVMLVLLIIFMVTAPLMQQGINVDLPETKGTGMEVSDKPFILVVTKKKQILAGKTKIPIRNLAKKLRAIFKTRRNKQVFIKADKNVAYGFVAQTLAEVRSAGIYNIALITLPKTTL